MAILISRNQIKSFCRKQLTLKHNSNFVRWNQVTVLPLVTHPPGITQFTGRLCYRWRENRRCGSWVCHNERHQRRCGGNIPWTWSRFVSKSGWHRSDQWKNHPVNPQKTGTELLAGMIGEGTHTFQIMNPDLLICTLDSSARMDIELTIGKGRGYVPAEDNKPKDAL